MTTYVRVIGRNSQQATQSTRDRQRAATKAQSHRMTKARFNREQDVVAAKVRSVAAYSVLIMQAASAAASVAASKRCLLLLGDAVASARTLAAKVLIFAATTPCSRLNFALVIAVELSLRCWPDGHGDTKTTGRQVGLRVALTWGYTVYMSAAENLEQELCLFFLIQFHLFVVLLGRGRRGQRKRSWRSCRCGGADSSGAEERRIDQTSVCWCLVLLVASSAACCCCLLLPQHAVAAAAAGRSFCCTTAAPASSFAADVASACFPNNNPIFNPFPTSIGECR